MSILNQYVNYFPAAVAKENTAAYFGTKVLLRDILLQMHAKSEHLQYISSLRSLQGKVQKRYKRYHVPCFTVSCYCEKEGKGSRNSEDEIYRTGLICIDLDPKDPTVDFLAFKQCIIIEPYIAYCGLSCRGKGIFIIVHVAEPDKHLPYFDFFKVWLDKNGYLSTFDKQTTNINRLRFIAPDPGHYINDNTIPFKLPPPKPKTIINNFNRKPYTGNHSLTNPVNKFEVASRIIEKQGHFFRDHERHNYIFHLCCLLNKMGVPKHEAESYVSTLLPLSEVKSNCIDSPYKRYANEFNTWDNSSHP